MCFAVDNKKKTCIKKEGEESKGNGVFDVEWWCWWCWCWWWKKCWYCCCCCCWGHWLKFAYDTMRGVSARCCWVSFFFFFLFLHCWWFDYYELFFFFALRWRWTLEIWEMTMEASFSSFSFFFSTLYFVLSSYLLTFSPCYYCWISCIMVLDWDVDTYSKRARVAKYRQSSWFLAVLWSSIA